MSPDQSAGLPRPSVNCRCGEAGSFTNFVGIDDGAEFVHQFIDGPGAVDQRLKAGVEFRDDRADKATFHAFERIVPFHPRDFGGELLHRIAKAGQEEPDVEQVPAARPVGQRKSLQRKRRRLGIGNPDRTEGNCRCVLQCARRIDRRESDEGDFRSVRLPILLKIVQVQAADFRFLTSILVRHQSRIESGTPETVKDLADRQSGQGERRGRRSPGPRSADAHGQGQVPFPRSAMNAPHSSIRRASLKKPSRRRRQRVDAQGRSLSRYC